LAKNKSTTQHRLDCMVPAAGLATLNAGACGWALNPDCRRLRLGVEPVTAGWALNKHYRLGVEVTAGWALNQSLPAGLTNL
jgi:hypothetical protein